MSPAGKAHPGPGNRAWRWRGFDGLLLSFLTMTLLSYLNTGQVIGVALDSLEQPLSSHLEEGGVALATLGCFPSPRGRCDYCKSSDLIYFIFSFFLLVMLFSGCHSYQMWPSSAGGSTADALVPLHSRSLHVPIARANARCPLAVAEGGAWIVSVH